MEGHEMGIVDNPDLLFRSPCNCPWNGRPENSDLSAHETGFGYLRSDWPDRMWV